jgi:CheY-like chemotaxis protein
VKLLIVDDSSAMRRVVARTVAQAGFVAEVSEAADGHEALALMARVRFDLVLSDVYMPRLNGMDLLARLRDDPTLAAVPVVMITTETEPAVLRRLVEQGASACLSKPFTAEALARVIEATLGR